MVTLDFGWFERQEIREAALPLQLLHSRLVREAVDGSATDLVVRSAQHDASGRRSTVGEWVGELCASARELVAVSHVNGTVEDYRRAFTLNRTLVERGQRMTSLFDITNMADDVADFLAGCDELPYFFCHGPVPLKLLDGARVLLEGPPAPGGISAMVVSRPEVVAAATRYVQVVRRHAVRCRDLRAPTLHGLTDRQQQIAGLLARSLTDDEISALVGVSVRTVRSDVATLMRVLGAETRFAAGIRYAQLTRPRD